MNDLPGPGEASDPSAGTVSWRELLAEVVARLQEAQVEAAALEARWIVEEASGLEGAEWVLGADAPATVRGVARLDAMVDRRVAGEPVQLVLGHWPFRSLDLLVDRRALIPRPETEQVVERALRALDDVLLGRVDGHRPLVVDLGTGTGAIGLAVAQERPGAQVWLTDRSPEALALARANLAGLGMAGGHVRVGEGVWFDALPAELAGAVDLVVSNPPYIGAHEDLPASVRDWEPLEALVPGATGLEAYEAIVPAAPRWLAPGGALVLEIGHEQGDAVAALATAAGFRVVEVHLDHAGLPRAVVARLPLDR